jgi:hypothetical protein
MTAGLDCITDQQANRGTLVSRCFRWFDDEWTSEISPAVRRAADRLVTVTWLRD